MRTTITVLLWGIMFGFLFWQGVEQIPIMFKSLATVCTTFSLIEDFKSLIKQS